MKILLLLATAGLLYMLQDWIYKTLWDKNLSVSIHFQDKAVLEGEQATLTEVIENRKLLPLAYLNVKFQVNRNLVFQNMENTSVSDFNYKNDIFSVLFHQRIRRTLVFSCQKRGYYEITQSDIISSNLLMTSEYISTLNQNIGGNGTVKITGGNITAKADGQGAGIGGGGGGGAVAPTTYDIVIPSALANTVKADKTKAAAGDTVTLTVSGEGTLTVTDANGKTVALTDLGSGKYTFKMPSAKVSVGFKTTADQPCDGGKDCPSAPFTDVDTAKWYHLSVDYVLTHKMMNGVSSRAFAPNANLTRGMLVQILYNLEGKPKGTAANFSDVQADAWYAEAVGWAASNKVVTGYADGTFRPNAAVTREQAAAILYRYAQSKGIDVSVGENTNILSYVDVQQASEYAIPALQWAVGAGVLNGKNGGRLAPTGTATRAEIAAIMQRWCENIIK